MAGEEPAGTFGETVEVSLAPVVVRVVDAGGEPVLGLGPDDFEVAVGRTRVPVRAVDFYSADHLPGLAADGPGAPSAGLPAAAALPPRLVVLFVQADFNGLRIRGHLRLLPYVEALLHDLPPDDLVAVVSFDSHLKLWQDFTRDRDEAWRAVWRGIHFGGTPPEERRHPRHRGPSLAAAFDRQAARDAASPERALELVADAAAPLPGDKTMIFLGWGLGRFGSSGFQQVPDYAPAGRALARAAMPVFVLDVTDADYHTLELGLRQVAAATGGTYEKTVDFPIQATRRLAATLASYYVLTIDPHDLPATGGELTVTLVGHRARLLMRLLRVPPAPG